MIGGANELECPCEWGLCGVTVCDDHSGRWRWWVFNIISGHDEHFAYTRTGGIEGEMDGWADGSASQLCTNSIWQAATGKRVQNEWWRGRMYFTVTGLKWAKAWKMSWSPSIKCLHSLGVQTRWSAAHSLKACHSLIKCHERYIAFILFTEHQQGFPKTCFKYFL